MGCASTKGAAAIPSTGNGNVPDDPTITVTTPEDNLKPPEVIIEGESAENEDPILDAPEDSSNPFDENNELGDNAIEDATDEAIQEIQLAVPEVPDESESLPPPSAEETGDPEEGDEGDKAEEDEGAMDTNEGDEAEDGPKVIRDPETVVSEE